MAETAWHPLFECLFFGVISEVLNREPVFSKNRCHSRKRSASGIGIMERQTADSGQAGMTEI